MESDLVVPSFANEAEEAEWVDKNRDLISDQISRAFEEGTIRRGSLVPPSQRKREEAVIPLSAVDASKARTLAEQHGIPYEIYLAKLLHQQLQKEELSAA